MTDDSQQQPDKREKSLGDQATDADVSHVDRERSLGDEVTVGELSPSPQPQEGFGGDLKSLGDLVDFEKRYQSEGELGQGGMGAVLLATDRRLKRKVAIKRIRHELAQSEKIIERFFTEAKSVAALNHSNIAQIYEMEQDTAGPYLVMEYVQGGSLLDKLKSGPLDPATAVEIVCKVCEALSVAHREGIIHQDIKPSNILLTLDGQPKLIDFGLARQEIAEEGQTQTGAVLGTMDFMPPEQQRDATAVDARSDLWSLAATLYQLITGEPPRVIDRNAIPENLRSTLTTALKQNPAERFQTAEEFKRALGKGKNTATVRMPSDLADDVCPSCNKDNDPGSKFCRGCGKPLFIKCLSCDNRMPVWDECCSECGCKQADQAAAAQAAAAKAIVAQAAAEKARILTDHGSTATSLASSSDVRLFEAVTGKVVTFTGHRSSVYSVAFSPDGKRVVSGSAHSWIKLWDNGTGQEIITLKGHTDRVKAVAFSPDGRKIVSGGSDATMKVWDVGTGEPRTFQGHTSSVNSVAFSPDGKRIVSGGADATLKVWDVGTGEPRTFQGHKSSVNSVAFSPDGKRIVSGSDDHTLMVWDLNSSQQMLTLQGHLREVLAVAFSPDGKRIASGNGDKMLKVWDSETGLEIDTLVGHSRSIWSVAFGPHGQQIVSGSADRTLKVWDVETGQQQFTLTGHTDGVSSVAFSLDGSQIVSGSWDNTLKVWAG